MSRLASVHLNVYQPDVGLSPILGYIYINVHVFQVFILQTAHITVTVLSRYRVYICIGAAYTDTDAAYTDTNLKCATLHVHREYMYVWGGG